MNNLPTPHWDKEPYIQRAMELAGDRQRPISHVRSDFEQLLEDLYMTSRRQLLGQVLDIWMNQVTSIHQDNDK